MNSKLRFFCFALLTVGVVWQFSPTNCAAQSVAINVDAPDLKVSLLNSDGTLNQTPVLCSDVQAFSGQLMPSAASAIAEARCRDRLLEGAAYNLKNSPLLAGLNAEGGQHDYKGMAQSLTRIIILEQGESNPANSDAQEGDGAESGNKIHLSVELTPLYSDLPGALKAGVADPVFQFMQAKALALEQGSLAEIEKMLPQILNGTMEGALLKPCLNRLAALALCRQYLEPPNSSLPGGESRVQQIEQAMNQAALADPNNPLVFSMLGDNRLKSGRSAQAVASYSQALKFDPGFLPAIAGRGTAYLRLNLLDLALADFSRAIELDPENPDNYMARASALLMQEDFPSMCRDFRTACGKGKCEGYNWAVDSGHCQK
ncbi:MAG: tetratricopeptide repeat protein [Desulfovibrionaceae bacterium]|nr:tetratricopeptide repeat protein [Desulfovibrionaceae bacterium]